MPTPDPEWRLLSPLSPSEQDLFKLWGGDPPKHTNGSVAYASVDIFRCLYPVASGPEGYRSAATNTVMNGGLPSGAVVEVVHRRDGLAHGMWFYLSPGSGIFLDLGRTRVFSDHKEARSINCPNTFEPAFSECLVRAAAGPAGYDTIQFTRRSETIFKFEILLLVSGAHGVCPPASAAHRIRQGWDAALPCECNASQPQLHCMPGR